MGNFSINNGGVIVNKSGMPNIDLRYGPYESVAAAHAYLTENDVAAENLVVGVINQATGETEEYAYIGGVSLQNLRPRVKRQHLKLLMIGNSFSCDALAYLPWLLNDIAPELDYTLGIACRGGGNLAEHENLIAKDSASYIFFYIKKGETAWTSVNQSKFSTILGYTDWGFITLQQQSVRSPIWSTYEPYLSHIIAHLNSSIPNVKLGWVLTQSSADGGTNFPDSTLDPEGKYQTSAAMMEGQVECAKKVMDSTPIDFIIPSGTAIQFARQGALDDIGTFGHLTYDCYHLEEGLPSLIAAYATAVVVLNALHLPHSINGNTIRPTAQWLSGKNIPNPQGSSVGVTDANCAEGQRCAIMAVKNPFAFGATKSPDDDSDTEQTEYLYLSPRWESGYISTADKNYEVLGNESWKSYTETDFERKFKVVKKQDVIPLENLVSVNSTNLFFRVGVFLNMPSQSTVSVDLRIPNATDAIQSITKAEILSQCPGAQYIVLHVLNSVGPNSSTDISSLPDTAINADVRIKLSNPDYVPARSSLTPEQEEKLNNLSFDGTKLVIDGKAWVFPTPLLRKNSLTPSGHQTFNDVVLGPSEGPFTIHYVLTPYDSNTGSYLGAPSSVNEVIENGDVYHGPITLASGDKVLVSFVLVESYSMPSSIATMEAEYIEINPPSDGQLGATEPISNGGTIEF